MYATEGRFWRSIGPDFSGPCLCCSHHNFVFCGQKKSHRPPLPTVASAGRDPRGIFLTAVKQAMCDLRGLPGIRGGLVILQRSIRQERDSHGRLSESRRAIRSRSSRVGCFPLAGTPFPKNQLQLLFLVTPGMALLKDQFSLSPLRTIRAFQFDVRHLKNWFHPSLNQSNRPFKEIWHWGWMAQCSRCFRAFRA